MSAPQLSNVCAAKGTAMAFWSARLHNLNEVSASLKQGRLPLSASSVCLTYRQIRHGQSYCRLLVALVIEYKINAVFVYLN